MKKNIFLVVILLCSTLKAETTFVFSGDALVKGYFKNSTGMDGTQAFNQYFRLNVDAKPDADLTIKTGLIISGNTWEGDTHTTNASGSLTNPSVDNDGGGGDLSRLDHASIDYKKNEYLVSIGRIAVTSPGSFLTSDDRRDRVQILKFQTAGAWAFVYDKRSEGVMNNGRDDLDMFSINYYGKFDGLNFALQTGYWNSQTNYSLKNLKQFTPQLDGSLFGVHYNFYYTYLGGGSNNAASLYSKNHHSAALVLVKEFGNTNVSYQTIATAHGGLIAGGYDTFSSIVNNSPDHHQSSIKLRTIGFGFGRTEANEQMNMIKVSHQFSSDFLVSCSTGIARFYVWGLTPALSRIENNKIVDLTFKYTVSKFLSINTAYGKFFGNNKDSAGSLTFNARF